MRLAARDRERLNEHGWVELEVQTSSDLHLIGQDLGRVLAHPNGKLIDHVSPKSQQQALPGTLSSQHGLGSFPLHTDTAFWVEPARYLLLMACARSDTGTQVIHSRTFLEKIGPAGRDLATRALFLVRTPTSHHYAPMLFANAATIGFRFDSTCMQAANSCAQQLQSLIAASPISEHATTVEWRGNNALLIDNWACLHGRPTLTQSSVERTLARIYASPI